MKNSLEYYRSLNHKDLVKALDRRHRKVLDEVTKLVGEECVTNISHFREEGDTRATYIYEIKVSDLLFKSTFESVKAIARKHNCYYKVFKAGVYNGFVRASDVLVIFTSKFAEYKEKNV